MNYDDFPILSNDEYQLINEQYSQIDRFDRKTILIKLCNELMESKFFCFELASKHNLKIRESIENTHSILEKLHNNLSTTFNINIQGNKTVKCVTIFTLMKKLNSINSLFQSWLKNEQKEYYKSIIQKSILDIIKVFENLFSALEKSNIYFFKHM